MHTHESLMTTRNLSIGYKSGKNVQVVGENLNLHLHAGQMVCLLGPNGSGKSTLMRTLAGLHPALSGEIFLGSVPLTGLKPAELAVKLSLVLTERLEAGNLTAFEVVSLGRTPYTGWLGQLNVADEAQINWAIKATGIYDLQHKRLHQLSDGERQKVMLARALAQDTEIIILDEPTAHLDLPSRVEMMHLLHTLVRQTGKAILLSTHELDLALQAADAVWLMEQNGKLAAGLPEDLVLNGTFESTFSKSGFYFDRNSGNFTIHRDQPSINIYLSGAPGMTFWAKRALGREGIGTNAESDSHFKILATDAGTWLLDRNGSLSSHHSLSDLLKILHESIPFQKTSDS